MAKKKATKKKAAASTKAANSVDHRRQEVRQIVKNACDQLNSEGVDARNYVEQLAWLFFLKAFDEAETRREEEAAFDDTPYERRLSEPFAWSSWASKTDRPDEMLGFVDGKLWIKLTSPDPKKGLGDDPLAERFRRIFDNVRNYSRRGASFARVVQQVNKLEFSSETDVHVLSEIYEDLLKRVAADSAGYAGEFYTQRHIIRAMVEVVSPQVGDRVYDPCFGTSGFLGEAADYMRESVRGGKGKQLSGKDLERLQNATFYGLEIKPLTYLLGTMNMILHGIESANLELGNTLELHNQNVSEKDRYDVILSNPPYGGKMASELQTNFRVRSAATECLFLQHIMRNLAKGGRAAVILPEGVSFRGGPDQKVRQELLEQFNLHTILSLPAGCFLPYTQVKTNVFFFDRPKKTPARGQWATQKVWFYELLNDGFELRGTRRPIDGNQFPEFIEFQKSKKLTACSWNRSVEDIADDYFDLSARNPTRRSSLSHEPTPKVMESMRREANLTTGLLESLEVAFDTPEIESNRSDSCWEKTSIGEVASSIQYGYTASSTTQPIGPKFLRITDIQNEAVNWETVPFCEATETTSKKYRLNQHDILFARTGATTGKSYFVAESPGNALFASYLIRLQIDTEKVLPEFVYLFFQSPSYWNQINDNMRGGAQPNVNSRVLSNLKISYPVCKEKQREIVDAAKSSISVVAKVEQSLREQLEIANSLRDSILGEAFAGEL